MKAKKITKKQRKQLDVIFKKNNIHEKADHLISFIEGAIGYLSTYIDTFKFENNHFVNSNIKASCIELSQKGYPVFWGYFKKINGDAYWVKRLISDTSASYEKLKEHEAELINDFINSEGNIKAYLVQLQETRKLNKKLKTNSISLLSSQSVNSIVDINWEATVKDKWWLKSKKIRIQIKELPQQKVDVIINYNSDPSKTLTCLVEIDKKNNVIIKSAIDNGKTLTCKLSIDNIEKKIAQFQMLFSYRYRKINIKNTLTFINKDIIILSKLGIICHLSNTISNFSQNIKTDYEYKEMAFYFDQISRHIVSTSDSPANSLLGLRVITLSVLPYSFYLAGLIYIIVFVAVIKSILLLTMLCFILLAYVLLCENYFLIGLLRHAHKYDNNYSSIQKDISLIKIIIFLLLLSPTLPFIGLSLLLRKQLPLNYAISLFRSRNNLLIRRLISLGVAVMPWVHLARKKWLNEKLSYFISKIKNKNTETSKAIVASIGNGFDWLIPFNSKNQELSDIIFFEADSKSVISVKNQLLNSKKLFINNTHQTKSTFIPINITKHGIKPLLESIHNIENSSSSSSPFIITHDGLFCYLDRKIINQILRQLSKVDRPIIIIGDWEIYINNYSHEPESDNGLFDLFKDANQKKRLKKENNELHEKYHGKLSLPEFKELISNYNFTNYDETETCFNKSDMAYAIDLLKNKEKEMNNKYIWPINRIANKLILPNYRKQKTENHTAYFVVLINDRAKDLLDSLKS